jgi:hypothetical protein
MKSLGMMRISHALSFAQCCWPVLFFMQTADVPETHRR